MNNDRIIPSVVSISWFVRFVLKHHNKLPLLPASIALPSICHSPFLAKCVSVLLRAQLSVTCERNRYSANGRVVMCWLAKTCITFSRLLNVNAKSNDWWGYFQVRMCIFAFGCAFSTCGLFGSFLYARTHTHTLGTLVGTDHRVRRCLKWVKVRPPLRMPP